MTFRSVFQNPVTILASFDGFLLYRCQSEYNLLVKISLKAIGDVRTLGE